MDALIPNLLQVSEAADELGLVSRPYPQEIVGDKNLT